MDLDDANVKKIHEKLHINIQSNATDEYIGENNTDQRPDNTNISIHRQQSRCTLGKYLANLNYVVVSPSY